jgi:hypothetical protein
MAALKNISHYGVVVDNAFLCPRASAGRVISYGIYIFLRAPQRDLLKYSKPFQGDNQL